MTAPTESLSNGTQHTPHHLAPTFPTVNILGVPVHLVTMREALSAIAEMATSSSSHQVATVNPEFIMTAQHNSEFRRILNNTSLSVADGIGVVWASRILGHRIAERVPGVDIVQGLAAIAATRGLRMFLLGAAPGVAELTARRLQEKHRGLLIAGTFAGSPKPEDDETICGIIEKAGPHLLFVAYSAPQQELWIARNQPRLNIPVAMGVGGTFDFIAGKAVRAPWVFQAIGLEWMYRLMREPWRWKRMLALPRFALAVFSQKLRADTSS